MEIKSKVIEHKKYKAIYVQEYGLIKDAEFYENKKSHTRTIEELPNGWFRVFTHDEFADSETTQYFNYKYVVYKQE